MKLNFALFRNDKKQGNQPDYRSPMKTPIVITEPGEYRVAGWKKEKDGAAYLSCILEKVVPGQDMGPTRDQNVQMIRETQQRLEGGQAAPDTYMHNHPNKAAQQPPYPPGYRPAVPPQNVRYGNPQRPPAPDDSELPF